MILNLLRTKTTKKLWFITLSLLCLYFYMVLHMGNSDCSTEDAKGEEREWDMTLQNLRQIVQSDDEDGKKPVLAGDFDVKEFLEQIRKDDLQWKQKKLTDEQVEEIGRHLKKEKEEKAENPKKLKHILYWNKAYESDEYGFCCGQTPFIEAKCPRNDCFATNNRSYMAHEDFDAILFHQRPMDHSDIPQNRSQHQRYIMWMMESAAYPFGFESSTWNGFFNWTMTFRQDSDFPFLYGHIVKRNGIDHPTEEKALQNFIEKFGQENSNLVGNKNKPIAWFASNCDSESKREDYVHELQKHIQVDIFGACGNLKCERTNETACWELVDREYYFYLSFENSICLDYVTEKFFNAMDRKVIPIVIGGTDYHNSAGAPKHSHINAYKDFKNPADLARYLQSLMDEPEKYAEYFWWKNFYRSDTSPQVQRYPAFCEACRQMHENHETKIYSDLEEWWIHKSKCRKVRVPNAN